MKVTLKIAFVFLFLSFLIVRPSSSEAYWHGHDHAYIGVNFGVWPGYYYGGPYYYPDYPYYSEPYYPGYTLVASSNYQPVVVNGVTYYVNNGVYYLYTQNGYQVVTTPVGASAPVVQAANVVAPASVDMDNSFTINIPNDKGGYNAVTLKKSGNGFVGPQGEFYADFPKVSQLQVMYGK